MPRLAKCVLLTCVLALLTASVPRASTTKVRTRKNVKAMTASEWSALESAIDTLKHNDDADPKTAWQSERTDSYAYFVKRHHAEAIHRTELIWMWHRAFLLQFEDALNKVKRASDPEITLPYWDWMEPTDGANGYPSAYERTASSLFRAGRALYPSPAATDTPFCVASGHSCNPADNNSAVEFMNSVLSEPTWLGFGGGTAAADDPLLNGQVHSVIHVEYVQGDMADVPGAAKDPLFWALHANLDRLIANWQFDHKTTRACTQCSKTLYRDPVIGVDFQVDALLDNAALPRGSGNHLKIVYAKPAVGASLPILQQPAKPGGTESLGKNLTLIDERTEFTFVLPALTTGNQLTLRMTGIRTPREHSYGVDVFVFPAAIRYDTSGEFGRKYRAGRFALMADSRHADDSQGVNISTELTPALRNPADTKAYKIAVVILPVKPLDYKGIASDVHVEDIELIHRQGEVKRRIELQAVPASPAARQ